jgi:hypothetical protein
MRTRMFVLLAAIFAGFGAAAVPRLGADENVATKGEEVSTVRDSDADPKEIARIHAEKRNRIEARLAGQGGGFVAGARADGEAGSAAKPAGLSTIGGALIAEPPIVSPVQITPAESGSQKLEPFSTIEIGPSELSPSERGKAGIQ